MITGVLAQRRKYEIRIIVLLALVIVFGVVVFAPGAVRLLQANQLGFVVPADIPQDVKNQLVEIYNLNNLVVKRWTAKGGTNWDPKSDWVDFIDAETGKRVIVKTSERMVITDL